MRGHSEVDLSSEEEANMDSDFSEIGEIINVSSDEESDSLEGFVNIRPGHIRQSSDMNARKTQMILKEIHYLYGNLTCLFLSRAL